MQSPRSKPPARPRTTALRSSRRWDVFCKVVDNFGDAGTAWRLARELCTEHRLEVTLWIDEPRVLARMAGLDPGLAAQRIMGIAVRSLATWSVEAGLPAVIVDVLGCGLPEPCIEAMRASREPPQWYVLEYLSAETWVDDRHALPSPHPATGLSRRFWFPGFTPKTGGLLRERDLLRRRDTFLRDQAQQRALWRMLHVDAPAGVKRVSLFCYVHAPVAPLLDAWSEAREPIVCFVPESVAGDALREWSCGTTPRIGQPLQRGNLLLHVVPFVSQDHYDELLWSCDFNFVRGEDSFVRAQWAAQPFAWHIYRQAADTHLVKLAAFLDRYTHGLPVPARDALRAFWHAWNAPQEQPGLAMTWTHLAEHCDVLQSHARAWCEELATLPGLATTLVESARRGL